MALKALLFDHDGTLVDSEMVHFAMWRTTIAAYGGDLTEAVYIDHCVGVPTPQTAEAMVALLKLPVEPAVLAAQKNAATRASLAREPFPLMPDTRAMLDLGRARGLKMAVVTGANGDGIRRTISGYGLESFFDEAISADDVARSKPHPDCYLLAMERLGVKPEECFAFEDTHAGVSAAANAGLRCVAIRNVYSAKHDLSRAVHVAGTLGEAVTWALAA